MTQKEFYYELSQRITVGCQLPFEIPKSALDSIVKYSSEWFYRNWEDALDNIYLSIPKEVWSNSEEFKKTRKVTLPECVFSVNAVAKDIKSNRNLTGFADFSLDKYLFSNWAIDGGFGGIEDITQSDALLGYVVASSWGDLTYHILNYPISYNFSRTTHKLFLKGSMDSNPDLLLDCDIRAPKEALYNLDLFFNYCLGMAKMDLSNILGTFQMELPGNASINYDRYYDQGKDLVDEVKEEVKNMGGGVDFFMHTGSL